MDRHTLQTMKDKLDLRLDRELSEMQPNYDDSITGFNQAWDIVRKTFQEMLDAQPR